VGRRKNPALKPVLLRKVGDTSSSAPGKVGAEKATQSWGEKRRQRFLQRFAFGTKGEKKNILEKQKEEKACCKNREGTNTSSPTSSSRENAVAACGGARGGLRGREILQ